MSDLDLIHEDARREGAIDRRRWLAWTAAPTATPIIGGRVEGRTARGIAFKSDPFAHGVASDAPDAAQALDVDKKRRASAPSLQLNNSL